MGDGPEIARVLLITSVDADGDRRSVGSGYLLGATLAITSAHAVVEGKDILVRPASSDEYASAEVLWADESADVALLLVVADVGEQYESVRFREEIAGTATLRGTAIGFPAFGVRHLRDREVRDVVQVSGQIEPLSGLRSQTYELVVDRPPTASTSAGSPWRGMSGAVLWIDGEIAGVINQTSGDNRLIATRTAPLLKDLAFQSLLPTTQPGIKQPESSTTPAPATTVKPVILPGAAADTVPEPGKGRVRRADRLGTAADVEMLVSVLLARDTPLPLAFGLFGKWGSGKSFFMAQMHERIMELAALAKEGRPEGAPYCREVRPVRFNAWHYADTNLWASLATTLFDELARDDAQDETQAKVSQLQEAQEKVASAKKHRAEVERDVDLLAIEVDRPTAVGRAAASIAIRAVRDDRKLRASLAKVASDDPEEVDASTQRLVNVLGNLSTLSDQAQAARRLFSQEILYRRRWTTAVTFAVLLVLVALGWATVATSVGARILTLVGAVLAASLPALSGALRILYLARDARELRQLPLVEKRDQLDQARKLESIAERELSQREEELAGLRDRGLAWRQFVRERAASSDYRNKLGLISQVRRDFERLVELLPGERPIDPKAVAQAAEAVSHERDIERIVLFIDDLDRCTHDKVVEVLQAVHLLLAFRLFVVVVGVDSGWLERSLREHYRTLLEEPDSYVEKIFQIPFRLERMSNSAYQHLIEHLTPVPIISHPATVEVIDRALQPADPKVDPNEASEPGITPAEPAGPAAEGNDDDPAESQVPALPRPEALVISDDERAFLGRLGPIMPTPRAAKRLVNIYRMLRVSVRDDESEAFRPGGGDEYQAVVVMLSIVVGRSEHAQPVLDALMAAPDNADIWEILAPFTDVSQPLEYLRDDVKVVEAGAYRRWAPRVTRFSLRLTAVRPGAAPS